MWNRMPFMRCPAFLFSSAPRTLSTAGRSARLVGRGVRAVVLLGLLAGCQSHSGALVVRQTPRTILYSYVIANGMARGRLMSDRVTVGEYMRILQSDRDALTAIMQFRDSPTNENLHNAGQRVEDFITLINSPPPTAAADNVQASVPAGQAPAMRIVH
jgi:hypothetical protein